MRVDMQPLNSASDVADLYAQKPFKEVINGMHNNGKMLPKNSRTYQIYTVNSLSDLINVVKKKYVAALAKANKEGYTISFEECMDLRRIRYLLTEGNELLFAEEGFEPAHFMMTGQTEKPSNSRCRCAGNLRFNDDFTHVEFINNKSGDFRPDDILLKRPLAVVVVLAEKNLISLQDSLEIGHERTSTSYTVSFNVLQQYVYQEFDAGQLEAFVWINENALHREVCYQPKQMERGRPPILSATKSSRNRLDFSDESIGILDFSKAPTERLILPEEPKSLCSFKGALFLNYVSFEEEKNSLPKKIPKDSSHSLPNVHKRKRNIFDSADITEVSSVDNQVKVGMAPKKIKFNEEENKEELYSAVGFK